MRGREGGLEAQHGPSSNHPGVWESLRASPHLPKVLQVHLPNKYFLTFPTGSELWAGLGQFLDCSQPGWPSPEGGVVVVEFADQIGLALHLC